MRITTFGRLHDPYKYTFFQVVQYSLLRYNVLGGVHGYHGQHQFTLSLAY